MNATDPRAATVLVVEDNPDNLMLVMDLLRVSDHPGNSATAPTMEEFFQ